MKSLPKSLHTVTVLVRVAHVLADAQGQIAPAIDWNAYVEGALHALGMADMPDTYALRTAAVRQLEKGK